MKIGINVLKDNSIETRFSPVNGRTVEVLDEDDSNDKYHVFLIGDPEVFGTRYRPTAPQQGTMGEWTMTWSVERSEEGYERIRLRVAHQQDGAPLGVEYDDDNGTLVLTCQSKSMIMGEH